MALRLQDVRVGAVAYLDHRLLALEPEIDHGDSIPDRPGPFVCVQVVGDNSTWCALTSEARPERLRLDAEWRRGGSERWREDDQYLNDGLATFLGPTVAFIRAGALETPFTRHQRPHVDQAGIQAILREIDVQGGPLHGPA